MVVLILVGVLLVIGVLLRVVGGILLGVLGRVLLTEALTIAIIIVDGGFAAKSSAKPAPISRANAERIIVPGKQAANRIGEQHAARDARRRLKRAGQETATLAAAAAPRAGCRARRWVALRRRLPAARRRWRRLVPAASW